MVDATTPKVEYAYTTPGAGQNYSRLASMTNPNVRVLGYSYASAIDSAVSRPTAVIEGVGGAAIETYSYLGLGTVVERARPGAGLKMTYVRQVADLEASSDGGDRYSGLDRFGRVADRNWLRTAAAAGGGPAAGTSAARLQYGYDRSGDATYRRDLVNAALSELYQYDGLDHLTSMKRGTLTASTAGGPYDAIASPTYQQGYTLDARGNQTSVATTVGGSTALAPTYAAAGNTLTKDGRTYVYDAWNRLVQVSQGGTVQASYSYDALGRCVKETLGSTTTLVYHDGGAAVEERTGGAAASNVSAVYVRGIGGDVVLRDSYASGVRTTSATVHTLTDANGNVVALVGGVAANSGQVLERYAYSPYGSVSFLNAAGAAKGSSAYAWRYLFQGGRLDATAGPTTPPPAPGCSATRSDSRAGTPTSTGSSAATR